MNLLYYLIIFFIGAVWGSFFYTLALKYIDGTIRSNLKEALFSSSRCPLCKSRINKLYLVPLIGFIYLRGRCRDCGGNINVEYPLYEVIYGVLLILTVKIFGFNINAASVFLITGVAIAISVVDFKTLIIPDSLVIVYLLISIYPIIYNFSFRDNLYGFIFMFLFFIIVMFLFPGSFGGGDLKFSSVIGLHLGLEFAIVVLETALITGAVSGVIYAVRTGKGFKSKIPFGPFLSFGLLIAQFYGREILYNYYRLF